MGSLRIQKVVYEGTNYYFESPLFDENLILIEGDNGTGKSTFCNLIYYGLGGRVSEFSRKEKQEQHKQITEDKDNRVELYIKINDESYKLTRHIDDNDITVSSTLEACDISTKSPLLIHNNDEPTSIFQVFRSPEVEYIFSDWILSKLGITVVELYQGYRNFKINFTDLMRLIYHDQQPDPKGVYKKLDTQSNFMNDSELLRKAIFELLVGKTFSEYYDSLSKSKALEKEKNIAAGLLKEYSRIIEELSGSSEPLNISFLQTSLQEKENQLERLHNARNNFKNNRHTKGAEVDQTLIDIKNQITEKQLNLSKLNQDLISTLGEKQQLNTVKENTLREISQIIKIIHSHDQLNLFSADTCPYCLGKVERATGHCVCGSEIQEEQYQRFFYTSKEYKEIYKAKIKTTQTIEIAIADCNQDLNTIQSNIRRLETEIPDLIRKIEERVDNLDTPIDLDTINDIDDKILNTRQDIEKIRQQIEAESKNVRLANDYEQKRSEHERSKLQTDKLEAQAKIDIQDKVGKLSSIYNKLMTDSLPDCTTARINLDDYLPIVGSGEYREASSAVSRRLMYYLALMNLSLSQEDVPFPRFLLIDTPETSGIELDNLKRCLEKIGELDGYGKSYQVILTTGLKKYPDSFIAHRKIYLPDKQNRLLIKKQNTQ
ncbi:AAA family ATPase [Metapseudomonas otitidis]|uniref:AAA family ATPase n=1 Tax=Metapseudomonas otitidis TaxID=319939 RepID=UPI001CA3B7F0|nr:AAA family ATPase [Pseudomonas otitidis]QZX80843.1 AAA family ATPase [Pseudomonas otitidis]